jgi:O-antigen ligase
MTQVMAAAPSPTHSAGVGPFAAASPKVVFMNSNVGGIDRVLRITVGLVLIALTLTGTIGLWGWLGLVPLATGTLRFCPVYPLLGMNTCPVKKS